MTTLQPIGHQPDIGIIFLGGCIWGHRVEVDLVLNQVHDTDFLDATVGIVIGAVRALIETNKPLGPQMVLDELRRTGSLDKHTAAILQTATTSGADTDLPLRHYGAAVVSDSLRRRVSNAGANLSTAAMESSENELGHIVSSAATSIYDCIARLQHLRGDAGEGGVA
jgi:replicative DNA helicase